jgi:hypothetical protein
VRPFSPEVDQSDRVVSAFARSKAGIERSNASRGMDVGLKTCLCDIFHDGNNEKCFLLGYVAVWLY